MKAEPERHLQRPNPLARLSTTLCTMETPPLPVQDQGSLLPSTPTPDFSFFLPRPLGVFNVCIFSGLSTKVTLLMPAV